MRICDLQTPIGRVQRETKLLRERWEETKRHWKDAAAAEFETNYLQALVPTLKLTLAAAYELAESVVEAERGCGDQAGGEE